MTKKFGKVKKQVRASNREQKKLQSESHDIPRTMIFCKSGASSTIRQLTEDFKSVMEPYTTTNLKCSKRNKMKNLIDNATVLNVKYIVYFTEKTAQKTSQNWDESTHYEMGGVYCHVVCVPHGPTFTYKVKEYSLKKDVQNANGFCMNSNWLQQPPLLILHGFGGASNENYLKAVSSSWQNMLPSINTNKTKIRTMRRVALISRYGSMPLADEKLQEDWGEVLVFRHYNIKLENKELNKSVRKLGIGAASRNAKIPDLSKYSSIEDYMTQTGNISESDMSDVEENATVDLIESMKELPGCSGKTAIKMMEVGPRITMQLLKIETGVHSGAVIYHRFVKKTAEEVFNSEKIRTEKLKLKQSRRKQQEKNVELKNKTKEKKKENKGKKNEGDSDSEGSAKEEGKDELAEGEVKDEEDEVADDAEEEEVEDVEGDDDESEGIEEVNDSMDESDEGDVGLEDDESSEGLEDIESDNESLDDDCDEDDIENVEDSMDDDVEDDEVVDSESEEDVQPQKPMSGKKRHLEVIHKSNKKPRCK